jgi:hypothetical protein
MVALILGALAVVASNTYMNAQLDRTLQAIRRAGHPTTGEEFIAWYGQAKGPNAADVYYRAFAAITLPSSSARPVLPFVGDAEYPGGFAPLSPELLAAIREHLTRNSSALDLLHQATAIPECYFTVLEYTEEVGSQLLFDIDEWTHFRNAIALLRLEAILAAEDKDAVRCVRSLEASVALTNACANRPSASDLLFAGALRGGALASLNRILNKLGDVPVDFVPLERALTQGDASLLMQRALIGDLYAQVSMRCSPWVSDQYEWDFADTSVKELLEFNPLTARVRSLAGLDISELIDMLNLQMRLVEISALPYGQRMEGFSALNAPNAIHTMVIDTTSRFAMAENSEKAKIRILRTALAIDSYQRELKKFPPQLDDLVPSLLTSVPIDPFDDNPLKYRLTDSGYLLYSIGPDMKDDGGRGTVPVMEGDVRFLRALSPSPDSYPGDS